MNESNRPTFPLLDFATLDFQAIPHSASVGLALVDGPRGAALQVHLDSSDPLPGLEIVAPGGAWDLSGYLYLSFDVTHRGPEEILVSGRLNGDK